MKAKDRMGRKGRKGRMNEMDKTTNLRRHYTESKRQNELDKQTR
jgi:hypothetical protein